MILLLCKTEQVDMWMKISEWGINGSVTIISVLIAAYLAYRYGVKRLRKETVVLIEREKFNRTLDSLQGCWKLLAYTTNTENKKCILTFTLEKGKTKTYFGNVENVKEFIQELSLYFYSGGLGLYLPVHIRKLLFEYRSIVYGFLLSEKDNPDSIVKIKKVEMVNKMIQIHQELIKLLRDELKLNNPGLE